MEGLGEFTFGAVHERDEEGRGRGVGEHFVAAPNNGFFPGDAGETRLIADPLDEARPGFAIARAALRVARLPFLPTMRRGFMFRR